MGAEQSNSSVRSSGSTGRSKLGKSGRSADRFKPSGRVNGISNSCTETDKQPEISCEPKVWLRSNTGLGCKLRGQVKIIIPKSVVEICDECFKFCREIEEVTFEEGSCLKKIGFHAFYHCETITKIVIPKTVEELCVGCFERCRSLAQVKFEEGSIIKKIGSSAFEDTIIDDLIIPKSVQEIGKECFMNLSNKCLRTVSFEEGTNIKKLGDRAFYYSNIRKFVIPKSVEEIGTECFSECHSLSQVTFENETMIKTFSRMSFYKTLLKTFVIPRHIQKIPSYCFAHCTSLFEVKFEEGSSVREYEGEAFVETGLKSFRIPKSVEVIGIHCFDGCRALSHVSFEEGSILKEIGIAAFRNTSITSFVIPAMVEELGGGCFEGCKTLSEIVFNGSCIDRDRVGGRVFVNTALTSIYVPKGTKDQLLPAINRAFYFSIYEKAPPRIVESEPLEDIVSLTGEESSTDYEDCNVSEITANMSDLVIDITEYKRVRSLGSGGFGNVFLYKKGELLVAAKFIPSSNEKNQTIFERETENLRSLVHPFIVPIRGYSLPSINNDYNFVIIMEHVAGGSLASIMDNSPDWFDTTAKTIIIYGIALGMSYVHSKGIIHCDLKPGNVLLDNDHMPRICDFGSSRLFLNEKTPTLPSFTARYGAPEIYKEQAYNEKIDVYSFGVILYELVTGKSAFCRLSQYQLMNRILIQEERETIPESVSPFIRDLIEQCWAQDPHQRPSFAEVCSLLKKNAQKIFADSDAERIKSFTRKYGR